MRISHRDGGPAILACALLINCLTLDRVMLAQQIPIPRIEQMSAMPAPYLMRDWKQVARGYDSLVFNTALQGQYLPLSKKYTATTNYPGIETFALQSYVGSSLDNGEGINCIPAIVGASLAGIDKSDQQGVNWVQMCREWFNKANGQNVYLNSPGGTTPDDWWYQTMPNVFFYQLYSLYPGSADFASQFVSVADRWLAALQAMGGSTAPWSIANVNHQAFNFSTMKPVDATWVEPEAAGAIAWMLYQAFIVTGDQRYREGAELAMESLLVYNTNPSYELQLPYGVCVAARMNAELGTTYDLTKMLNWCFSNGDGTLRQWGVSVGTWGGFDCSGLVGEINHSNDYPFFMNGVEQAGALTPVVRYDDRYARAMGKWILHLANASRLFYTSFLPDDHQDSYVWGHQYDPESWIAHESLRQYNPSNSAITPYLTGDAIQGGWAPTNFALYGASHVGILAGILDTTDVPMVLRIDLLKTDYFHGPAYPTYLFYNPYPSDTTVALNVGQGSFDLYNTVTKQFLAHGVSGTTSIVIPADGAVVVVLAPAGGTLSYRLDQTLIDSVVVDYRSGRAVMNYPPRVKALAPVLPAVPLSGTTDVYCTATDRDGDSLGYTWAASEGVLSGSGRVVHWTAPDTTGHAVLE
ncbi:MAG: laminin G, partial [Bacteroidota bacterium]